MSTPPAATPPARRLIIAFCGLSLALNAFSCDILLPTFFAIQADLGGPIERAQAAIPVFLISAGFGQLLFGPLSDRFGRRPVMALGLVLYIAGALAAMLAPSVTALLASRMLQGLGSACGVVVARAILRDTHGGTELASAMSLAMTIFAVGPMVAPLLGVAAMAIGGWRGAFACMTVFGSLLLLTLLTRIPESNRAPDVHSLRPAALRAATARVLTNPQSRHFLLGGLLNGFLVVFMIVNAPRLYKSSFGIEGAHFAMLFALIVAGIIAGQFVNSRLVARVGVVGSTRLASAAMVAVFAALAAMAWAGALDAASFTGLLMAFNACLVVVLSNCMSLVLDPHRDIAGLASSVYGFITQVSGSVLALALLPLVDGAIGPWTLVELAAATVTMLVIVSYRPRALHPAPEPAVATGR